MKNIFIYLFSFIYIMLLLFSVNCGNDDDDDDDITPSFLDLSLANFDNITEQYIKQAQN